MALLFDAITERITIADNASYRDQTAFSAIIIVKRNTLKEATVLDKSSGATRKRFSFYWSSTSELEMIVWRATVNATSISNNLTLNSTTIPMIIAMTYNEADGIKLYGSDSLQVPLAEATYATQTIGSGATTADSGVSLLLGNIPSFNLNPALNYSYFHWVNKRCSLSELLQIQYNPCCCLPDSAIILQLGIHGANGVGVQKDWSGNGNDGTITGAIKIDHAPIKIFPRLAITQELAQTLFPDPIVLTLTTVAPVIGYTLKPSPVNLTLSTVDPVVTTGANKYPWYAYPPMIRGPL